MKLKQLFVPPKFIVVTLLYAVLVLGIWGIQKTIDAPEEQATGDRQYVYVRGETIARFLDAAFTEKIWNEDKLYHKFTKGLSGPKVPASIDKLEISTPWLAKYLHRADGWPDNGVIHKWEKPELKIMVGHPPHQGTDFVSQYRERIKKDLQDLLPKIELITGKKIKIVDLAEPGAMSVDIFLFPTERLEVPMGSFVGGPFVHEPWLWGAELFESSDSKMRGYMLPKADNSAGLAVCKVRIKTKQPGLFKSLISECLLRSMGLPGLVKHTDSMILGQWRPHESEAQKEVLKPMAVSGDDLDLLRILYCPKIKSGMSKNTIFLKESILAECF